MHPQTLRCKMSSTRWKMAGRDITGHSSIACRWLRTQDRNGESKCPNHEFANAPNLTPFCVWIVNLRSLIPNKFIQVPHITTHSMTIHLASGVRQPCLRTTFPILANPSLKLHAFSKFFCSFQMWPAWEFTAIEKRTSSAS